MYDYKLETHILKNSDDLSLELDTLSELCCSCVLVLWSGYWMLEAAKACIPCLNLNKLRLCRQSNKNRQRISMWYVINLKNRCCDNRLGVPSTSFLQYLAEMIYFDQPIPVLSVSQFWTCQFQFPTAGHGGQRHILNMNSVDIQIQALSHSLQIDRAVQGLQTPW